MEVSRLYLDTNVLIVLGEGSGTIADLLTELAVQEQGGGPSFLCTSELTLSELLVQPHRDNNDELIDRYDGWLTSGSFMEVGPIHRPVLWYAAVLRAAYRSVKLPDAIHLATAIGFGCSHMLTADERLPELVELTHTRYGMTKGPARLKILRPDAETLRSIIDRQKTA